MVETRRHRTALAAVIILASLLLFGCDFFDGLSESGGSREAEKIREETQRDLQEAWDAQEGEDQGQQSQETAPADQEDGALTGAQDSPATGPITAQEIAGTYSASAALQHVQGDVESADSLPVTLQLNDAGTGTANVNGYGGAAQYAGSSVSFSVTMEEGGQSVLCSYKGVIARSEDSSQIAITGTMNCSMMGVSFASYNWTAYK
ncbi:MAG: hypothetical protein JXP37_09875 [Coriobacteriia bacterium]|nr:hypothetical protein [Coriobacteriia bacterium]